MPTISVERTDLLNLLGREYTLEELEPLMDYVKGELKDYNAETDELKIELKDTNRADLWCPEGIARQIRCTYESLDYGSLLELADTTPEKQILVDDKIRPIRPYIGAFIAKGVPVTEEFLIQMIQTQEKLCDNYGKRRELIAIGIYNADKIVFPVRYNAVKPHDIRFVPLGCDEDMDLAEILTKHPKGIEFGGIVQAQERYPILVDQQGDVLSFPPVINSRISGEVTIGDQHLFIEITGLDLDMTLHAVNILAYNFKDRGFEIEPVVSAYPYETAYGKKVASPYPLANEVEVECALIEKYLGKTYRCEEIIAGLEKYGLLVNNREQPDRLVVSTYPYRQDYMHAVDAVEDFVIATGYNSFEPIMPERFTVGHLHSMTLYEDRVRETVIGVGFEEVILNILSNKEDFSDRVQGMSNELLEISNPMTENYSSLRNSLLPSLLKVEAASYASMYPHKVFEVGEVVIRDDGDNQRWATRSRLGALLAHAEANFSEMGSYVTQLQYLMFWNIKIQADNFPLFIPGRSAAIMTDATAVGVIGEVHPEILDTWGIKMPTVLFEVALPTLFTLADG
jgi:phenylalanyl-tRNA synthetase beta chain